MGRDAPPFLANAVPDDIIAFGNVAGIIHELMNNRIITFDDEEDSCECEECNCEAGLKCCKKDKV